VGKKRRKLDLSWSQLSRSPSRLQMYVPFVNPARSPIPHAFSSSSLPVMRRLEIYCGEKQTDVDIVESSHRTGTDALPLPPNPTTSSRPLSFSLAQPCIRTRWSQPRTTCIDLPLCPSYLWNTPTRQVAFARARGTMTFPTPTADTTDPPPPSAVTTLTHHAVWPATPHSSPSRSAHINTAPEVDHVYQPLVVAGDSNTTACFLSPSLGAPTFPKVFFLLAQRMHPASPTAPRKRHSAGRAATMRGQI
jgi:hypothetical protein